jgi:hypothetical protein
VNDTLTKSDEISTNRESGRIALLCSPLVIMPTNNTGFSAGRLFGKFPGRLAHLMSASPNPKHWMEPKVGIPWALDNGVFGAWKEEREWSEEPLYSYLERHQWHKPKWVVVPDWVADRDRTLKLWDEHAPALQAFGSPLAFVGQDGMTPADVPSEANIVFMGGSTSWKWRNLPEWVDAFPRVHVGRVNSPDMLTACQALGVESCDGTGWFRSPDRTATLEKWLESNELYNQQRLPL